MTLVDRLSRWSETVSYNVDQHHRPHPHTGCLTSWSPDIAQWQRECGGETHLMAEKTPSGRRTKVEWTRRRTRWGPMERALTSWEEWTKREWTSWSERLLITSQSPAHLPGNYFTNHVWLPYANICRWLVYICKLHLPMSLIFFLAKVAKVLQRIKSLQIPLLTTTFLPLKLNTWISIKTKQ